VGFSLVLVTLDRYGDEKRSSSSLSACNFDRSAERLHAVSETDESGPMGGICCSDAVVANRELDEARRR